MPWKKGETGNSKGRPKNPERELLRKALEKEGKKQGIDFLTHCAQLAFDEEDYDMAKVILKKFIPDLQSIEVDNPNQTQEVSKLKDALKAIMDHVQHNKDRT